MKLIKVKKSDKFKSKAQQRFLFARKPKLAKEFAEETPESAYKQLPEYVKAKDGDTWENYKRGFTKLALADQELKNAYNYFAIFKARAKNTHDNDAGRAIEDVERKMAEIKKIRQLMKKY